jgi:iron complex transport system substrate-binding protein
MVMRARVGILALLLPQLAAAELPTVASINLCTDQLVLTVAEPSQILSLSWLSADPEESMLAAQASRFPLNYGAAEELIGIGADVVIAGSETSPFTRQLLTRLGASVVEVTPATSLTEVAANLLAVGSAIERADAARRAIADMQARTEALRQQQIGPARSAIVVRPGGFTIGRGTLAHELIELAGLDNRIAELDRWGSLSVETLLVQDPEIVVTTTYRTHESSLANSIFSHPALASLGGSTLRLEVDAKYFACGAPESLRSAEVLLEQMAAH